MTHSASRQAQANWRNGVLHCEGNWTVGGLSALLGTPWDQANTLSQNFAVDGSQLKELDSAGAWVLADLRQRSQRQGGTCIWQGFSPATEPLLELVSRQSLEPVPHEIPLSPVQKIGCEASIKIREAIDFFDLSGRVCISLCSALRQSRRFHWPSIMSVLELTGVYALPITGLLAFLIGVVLAYQLGAQLQTYGANIFVVYLSGTAIFREFGPLITAIIIAGRTSSAFTAELGMMKVNQEIDAMLTIGLSPIDWLVLPRIIGLFLVFPLLVLWADVTGVMGSMFMAKGALGINYHTFLNEFKNAVPIETFWIGLSKAPVFALIIATVGCYQGFEVGTSADSVGRRTTQSVVQAIFLIIIADALFSIIYSMLRI